MFCSASALHPKDVRRALLDSLISSDYSDENTTSLVSRSCESGFSEERRARAKMWMKEEKFFLLFFLYERITHVIERRERREGEKKKKTSSFIHIFALALLFIYIFHSFSLSNQTKVRFFSYSHKSEQDVVTRIIHRGSEKISPLSLVLSFSRLDFLVR